MAVKRAKHFGLIACLLLMSLPIWGANDVSTIRLRQAFVDKSDVKVYFDLLDGEGRSVTNANFKQLKIVGSIGQNNASISEFQRFKDTKEGVAYIFLVDVSKSLTEQEFDLMQKSLNTWTEAMTPKDRAAIVTFGESVSIATDFTDNQSTLKKAIGLLSPKDMKTQLNLGISKAIELGRRYDSGLPTRRVIITLSDGKEDYTGGMIHDEVINALKEERLPIYAIGFCHPPLTSEKQKCLDSLGEFSRISGGDYFQPDTMPIDQIYAKIRERILNSYVAQLSTFGFKPDGKVSHIQLSVMLGSKTMSDGADVRLLPPPQVPPTDWLKVITHLEWWAYPIAFLVLAGIVLGIIVLVFKRKKPAKITMTSSSDSDSFSTAPLLGPNDLLSTANVVRANVGGGVKIKLVMIGSSERESREFTLADRVVIGREASENSMTFNDLDVSAKHCELYLKDGMVFINDLNSKNGTFLNGIPVKVARRLNNGDIVMIGQVEFRVSFSESSSY